ncbi:MAG: HAD family hydrolase [Prolixibacteraceae bacterium]|nr:HAD family hydrolase [Prolixibacteraceae bacterium]
MTPALFLDRDGVINEEINYLYKIEDFVFITEIFNICNFYQQNGYKIIVITNQAGIAREKYTEEDLKILNDWMTCQFYERGIKIDKIYHCPHHPDFTGYCECRKPNPGMILRATEELDLDLSRSVLIGDKDSDLEAGINAGIPNLFHIEEIRKRINNLPLF